MKRLISIVILTIAFNVTYAQDIEENTIVRETLDKMYEHLDKTKVPTGLLLDYAFDLLDFDRYDGTGLTDSNYVERSTFEYMLRSIRSAAVGTKPFKDVNSIMEDMSVNAGNTINIGLALFKYNYIRADALEKNLIRYENEQVYDSYDRNGTWIDPYAEKYIIGFSSYNYISTSISVSFSFPSEFLFSNTDIAGIEFDAGDGYGYRTIRPGSAVNISYPSEGTKELRMRVTLCTGEILLCHSQLIYTQDGARLNSSESNFNDPDNTRLFEYSSKSGIIKAHASVFYAKQNGTRSIRKPFIIAEGFDPMDLQSLLEKIGFSKGTNDENGYDLGFNTARETYEIIKKGTANNIINDYDIIYIDWFNSEADIRDNARLLIQIIDWVNENKLNSGSDERNVIMGQSMGGLIARYALRTMELEGKTHETDAYISHDSPHLGANIPLGAIYAIYDLLALSESGMTGIEILKSEFELSDASSTILKYLDAASVKQMLVNYVNLSGNLDNSIHDAWQTELNHIGFPTGDKGQDMTNLTVVNGGRINNPVKDHYIYIDGQFYSNSIFGLLTLVINPFLENILDIDLNWADFLPGKTNLSAHFEVNPYLYNGGKVFDFSIVYTKKILWLFNKKHVICASVKHAPLNGPAYDSFNGSLYTFKKILPLDKSGDIFILGGDIDLSLADRFMFIPTVSALCYGHGNPNLTTADYNRDFYSSPVKPLVEMPFHGAMLKPDATTHISTASDMYSWIEQQLATQIDGPSTPVSGDKYTMSGCPYPITWSTSNPSVATINSTTGVITVKGAGCITITATYHINSQKFSKSKSIMVGFPELYLTSYFDKAKGYVAEAKSTKGGKDLTSFIASGDITYEWGLKAGEEPIQWSTSSDSVYVVGVTKNTETTTVYVRLKGNNGVKGKTYNKPVAFYGHSYYVRPKCFVINKAGDLYAFDPKSGPYIITQENIPLTITYTIYTHETPDFSLPRAISIDDDETYYWTFLPQPDTSTWMIFPLFSEEKFYNILAQMKPQGDMERMEFWVTAYASEGVEVHLYPIYMLYRENFTENSYWNGEFTWPLQ